MCKRYDFIFLETLNLNGMTRLWGRKVNDLAHGEFVSRLEYVAVKYGCTVRKIDKFFPSSKLCTCGYKNSTLKLSDREWVCPQCDVLKCDVGCCNLLDTNARICSKFPTYSEYKEYHPHLTIAYLKKGMADKYLQDSIMPLILLKPQCFIWSGVDEGEKEINVKWI